jgi:cytidylate kinase
MNHSKDQSNIVFEKPFVIAIDGHSSCGKSTIARDLAKSLDFLYIDTGAMYRAITLLMLKNNISLDDESRIASILDEVRMEFIKVNGKRELHLNGKNVEKEIRTPEVAGLVSPVSEISLIRKKLVDMQRKMAQGERVILEGRDIGTVVFPDADIKFFITANVSKRTERRYKELLEKGTPLPFEEVMQNLTERDRIDSGRKDSPLRRAEDAILIDTTEHTRESQLKLVRLMVLRFLMNSQNL